MSSSGCTDQFRALWRAILDENLASVDHESDLQILSKLRFTRSRDMHSLPLRCLLLANVHLLRDDLRRQQTLARSHTSHEQDRMLRETLEEFAFRRALTAQLARLQSTSCTVHVGTPAWM